MTLPDSAYVQFTSDLRICRVLNGLWQASGTHGRIDPARAIPDMFSYHDAGLTTWDLADHYGPAEDFIGEFRRQLAARRGQDALAGVQAFTKWVPRSGPVSPEIVASSISISLRRMEFECLDLLQFHWWDYDDERYLDALTHLARLREDGKIKHLALTNFDTERLKRIGERGVPVVSNQVQYSLIDRRPEVQMATYCRAQGVHLLAYGALCGGLLSDRYLGQPAPGGAALNTASLRKYKQMVDAWGGWELFQELLVTLKGIAGSKRASIANVAVRYIVDRPAVAGVIAGVRLGLSEHRTDNARVFDIQLDEDDLGQIESVLSQSRDLYQLIGDCGDEYRR
jgi:aryl-alcohol dehydrogenase-like predicted oxidoreductase